MKYFKYIVLCLSISLVFPNDTYPTQQQIDNMLKGAMEQIWLEAMRANTAVNEVMSRHSLKNNLKS